MDSQFKSMESITKLSSITRNLSGSHPSRRVFESFKSIRDISKTDLKQDLRKKYFGLFSDDIRNNLSKDLKGNEFKSIKEMCVRTTTDGVPKENMYKDQSVQTDIREFAKIKLSSDLCESAANYMQFAEEFIEEVESECFHNSMQLTSIPTYRNKQLNPNRNGNQFNGNKSLKKSPFNDRVNYQIFSSDSTSDQTNKYSMTQIIGDMKSSTTSHILESNVIVYEADNCQVYEFGEEALESQLTAFYPKINFNSNVSNDSDDFQTQSKPIKWSDLVRLIKSNQFNKHLHKNLK